MKLPLLSLLLSTITFGCQQPTKTLTEAKDNAQSAIIDSTFQDTVKEHIQFVSDRHFSNFKTSIEARLFKNGLQTDSIIQSNFNMISWYSNNKDTIDLVAHVGGFETSTLLVRFIDKKPEVFFLRALHEGQNYFRLRKTDTFTNQIEVSPRRYKLQLSQIPDTNSKPVLFAHIDMESGDYYDKRDSLQQPHKIQMKFYFRSQYRKFNY